MSREEFNKSLKEMGFIELGLEEAVQVPDLNFKNEDKYFTIGDEDEKGLTTPELDEASLPYIWQSQYYEFGNYIKKLNDLFLELDLPYEKKKCYLDTLRGLYKKCVNETLTWELIQTSLFLDNDILDVLIEKTGSIGEAIKENLAFQFVCIQQAQWEKEE